jgi:hypothetical protein
MRRTAPCISSRRPTGRSRRCGRVGERSTEPANTRWPWPSPTAGSAAGSTQNRCVPVEDSDLANDRFTDEPAPADGRRTEARRSARLPTRSATGSEYRLATGPGERRWAPPDGTALDIKLAATDNSATHTRRSLPAAEYSATSAAVLGKDDGADSSSCQPAARPRPTRAPVGSMSPIATATQRTTWEPSCSRKPTRAMSMPCSSAMARSPPDNSQS